MSGRDLFPEMPAETCVGVYRVRYSYYPGLVAGLRLLCPDTHEVGTNA